MSLRPLDASTRVADRAFEAIYGAIMSGELPAGHRLRIRELSSLLGTSVMPVREAIRRLEETGLAEAEPYRGAVVRTFTPRTLLNIYSVRSLLEVDAAIRGAALCTPADIAWLEEELARLATLIERGEVIGYLDSDEAFLTRIYGAADNSVLLETIQNLWSRCRMFKIVGVQHELETGRTSELLIHQRRLMEAVRAGDPQRAGRITEESLDAASKRIREAFPAEPHA